MGKEFAIGACGVIVAIAAALGIGSLIENPDPNRPPDTVVDTVDYTGNVLRTTNRETYKVCVEFLDVPFSDVIANNIEKGFTDAAGDPLFSGFGGPTAPPMVDIGCPAAPADGHPRCVDVPSEYVIFTFVVSDEARRRIVERVGIPLDTQEIVCGTPTEGGLRDSTGFEATSAMYIRENAARDLSKIWLLARQAYGLEGPPNTWFGDWR
jgi:hypothetical protein